MTERWTLTPDGYAVADEEPPTDDSEPCGLWPGSAIPCPKPPRRRPKRRQPQKESP